MTFVMNFGGFDSPGNDHFPAHQVIRPFEYPDRLGSTHLAMILVVMSDPDRLIVRNPKVNTDKSFGSAPLEFPQPLMSHEKVTHDRHCIRSGTDLIDKDSLPSNPGSKDRFRYRF
ncbi:hypothetical protein FGO68_gene561 [Halteria grandinella]|uniref:Uncharacterized protein n=1 Tax=Halteria grandinella TaxID=5974 RepID=A0A8J8N9N9_HALGN|nr:hypothetical protein FGO68_gene561 [Halteria grandinella]